MGDPLEVGKFLAKPSPPGSCVYPACRAMASCITPCFMDSSLLHVSKDNNRDSKEDDLIALLSLRVQFAIPDEKLDEL